MSRTTIHFDRTKFELRWETNNEIIGKRVLKPVIFDDLLKRASKAWPKARRQDSNCFRELALKAPSGPKYPICLSALNASESKTLAAWLSDTRRWAGVPHVY
jgi:hypothetical protein